MRTLLSTGGKIAAALALTLALASPAMATGSNICKFKIFQRFTFCGGGGTIPRTPEIDPSLARGTLTILLGGVLVLAERRRRRQ
jgi:hypothetical protein